MSYSRKSNALYIDKEALSSLALVQEGLLTPVESLMGEKEAQEVDNTKKYKDIPMPYSFILAPKGKRNQETLLNIKRGDRVTLISQGREVGYLIVDETFKIDPLKRIFQIYGTTDTSFPAVNRTMKRLGEWAVSGKYEVNYPEIHASVHKVSKAIEENSAKKVSAMMLGANPLNRAHERIMRHALDNCDLLVIFLMKPFTEEGIDFNIRQESLCIFIEQFLPHNKIVVVPFENSYIFSGYNELILDALFAKNYGCTKLIVGRNHRALGAIYSENEMNTIFDNFKDINIKISLVNEYVYCDVCKTLVNQNTCPHGQHHHIHYHHKPLMKLIQNGIIPPTILVRKEISSYILASLFPNRFKNLQETYDMLIPSGGLLEEKSEKEFYIKLIELYQTSGLT
ncbi:MAG TPA: sulfate adenylyltransferase [Nitratifractor sp.]|nr:sulfate adenylyltransferase [Nitratifractor sp.]